MLGSKTKRITQLTTQLKDQATKHRLQQMELGKKYKGQMNRMEEKFAIIHEAIQVTNANLMLRLQDNTNIDGNAYPTHLAQVLEIMNLYTGKSEIGNDLVKRIINISAAIKLPNGLALEVNKDKKKSSAAELGYLEKFMEVNQFNESVCTELSKSAEKQGQVLVALVWDPSDNMVKVNYRPWHIYKYVVYPAGLNNLTPPYTIAWDENPDFKISAGTLSSANAAFVAFNSTFEPDSEGNLTVEGSPALGNVLPRIDDIGKDLLNWRRSNNLYSYPTPHAELETADEAQSLQSKITDLGWSVGNMLVTSGKFEMVVPDNFYDTIKEAIHTSLQIISGATGLSIGWLGFPGLMSNRATADSLGEPLEIVAANDITSWKSFYEQMFDNVLRIRNENMPENKPLQLGKVKPLLKPMSDRIWQQLIRLYMPAAEQRLISREGFLNKIPGINVVEEMKLLEKQLKEDEKREVDNIRRSNPDNRADTGQQSTGSKRFNNERG